jgi:hypothetical protein
VYDDYHNITIIFDRVSTAGNTYVREIVLAQEPADPTNLPPGYTTSNILKAYDITSTATYSDNINIKFGVPSNISQTKFNTIKVFHVTGSTTENSTGTGSYAPNYNNLTVGSTTTTLSPFYLMPSNDVPQVFPYTMTLQGETTLYQHQIRCHINENEFNYSMNPSIVVPGTTGSLRDFATGSDFRPYMTSIGLYNDRNELLVVAKFSVPIPVPPNTDMTVVVKYDT